LHHEGALEGVLLTTNAEEIPGIHPKVVGILQLPYMEVTRPPGESAERVSVSAAGSELAVDVRGGLDQDIDRRALTEEPRTQSGKPCRDNEKEQIAGPGQ